MFFIIGILDQGSGVLVLREPECDGKDYPLALSAIQSLGGIVDMLFQKTTKLKWHFGFPT